MVQKGKPSHKKNAAEILEEFQKFAAESKNALIFEEFRKAAYMTGTTLPFQVAQIAVPMCWTVKDFDQNDWDPPSRLHPIIRDWIRKHYPLQILI